MSNELLTKIVLLKQKAEDAKTVGVLYQKNAAMAVIDEAIFVLEEMAKTQVEMQKMIDDLLSGQAVVMVNGK